MKISNIFYLAFVAILITSCSVEDDSNEAELKDYSGIYDGILECTEGAENEIGESITISVIKDSDTDYTVDLGDEVIVDATLDNDGLIIPNQLIGEGQSFDIFYIEGDLRETPDGFVLTVIVDSVDDEDMSCSFDVVKR